MIWKTQVLLTTQGSDLVSKLLKMQQLEDEEELAYNAVQDDPSKLYILFKYHYYRLFY